MVVATVSLLSLRTCSLCTIFLVQHIVVAPSIIVITSNVQSLYNLFSSTYSSCSQYHCYHFERVVLVQPFQFNIQQLLLVSCYHFVVFVHLFSSTYSSCSQHHCYHFERVVFVQSFQQLQHIRTQLLLVSLLSLRTCSLCTIVLVQHIVVAPIVVPHCYHFERVVFVQSFQFNIQQLLLVSLLSLRTCSLCTIFLVQHIVVATGIIVITSNVQSLYNDFSSTYSSCTQHHCYHFERVVFVQSFQFNIQQLFLASLLSLRTCSLCTIFLVQHIVVAPSIIVITSNVQSLYNLFSSTYSSCSQHHCYHFERVVFVQSFQFNIQQLLLVSLLSLRTCSLCTIFLVQHIVVAPSIIVITSNVQSLYNLLVQHIVVAPSIIVITSNVQSLYNLFSSTYSSCSQYHCYHFDVQSLYNLFSSTYSSCSLLSLRTCIFVITSITCSLCTILFVQLVQHIVVAPSIIVITSNVQPLYNLFSSTYCSCSQYHCYHFERVVFVQSFQFNIQQLLLVSLLSLRTCSLCTIFQFNIQQLFLVSLLSLRTCSLCTIFLVQHIVVAPSIIVITSNVQSLYNLFSSTYSSCSQYHCYHFERVVFVQFFQFNILQLLLVSLLSLRTCSLCTIFQFNILQLLLVVAPIAVVPSCYHFERVVFVQSFQFNIQQLLLASLLSLRTCSLCTIFLVQHIVVAPSIIVITSNVQSLYNRFSSRYSSRSWYLCYHFERVVFVQSFQSNIQQLLLVSLLSLRTCSLCTIVLVQDIVVAPGTFVITSNVQSLYNLFSSTYSSCSQYHCYHFERVVFVQSFSLTYSSCSQYHCYHFERVVFVQSFQFKIQQSLLVPLLSLRTCSLCTIFLVQHIVVAPSIIVITSDVQSLYNFLSPTYSSCSQHHCYHFERVAFVQSFQFNKLQLLVVSLLSLRTLVFVKSFQFNIQQLLLASLLSLRTCSLCTIFLVQHIVVAPSIIVITSNVQPLYNLFSSTNCSCSQYHCYHFDRVVFVQSFQFKIQLLVPLLSLRTCSLCTIFLVQHIVVAPSIIVITSNVQSLYNLFSPTYSSCSQHHCYHFERVVFVQSFQFNIQQLLLVSLLSLRTCSLCTIVLVQDIVVAPGTFVITSNVQSLYNLFSPTYSSCSQYHCYHFERVVFVQSFQFNILQLLLVSLLSLRTCSLCTIFLV